jgi:NADH:ubiquinone oxidoreductase subunit 6 (subunit J)
MSSVHIALSAIVLALAVVSVASRRRIQAGAALALCTLGLAGVMLTLSAELLALIWALMGTGMLLVYLATDTQDDDEGAIASPGPGLWRLWPLLGGLILWLGLLAGLVDDHLPAEMFTFLRGPRDVTHGQVSAELLARSIYGRYAPALVGVSLTLLAALLSHLAARRDRSCL